MGDVDSWLAHVRDGGILPERDLRILCEKLKEIFIDESNVQVVSTPVSICGKTNGHFDDLLQLFEKGGQLPDTRYIFLGDYVNKGNNGVESCTLLLCLKLKYPNSITLLRGKSETKISSTCFGLYDEVRRKYGNQNAWTYFSDVFDYMGIAALVDGKILCMHGGLTPQIVTLDQISLIDRFSDPDQESPYFGLIFSKPQKDGLEGWDYMTFGSVVTTQFNLVNDLELIASSSGLTMQGYEYFFPDQNFVNITSAPNYCNRVGNSAAIL